MLFTTADNDSNADICTILQERKSSLRKYNYKALENNNGFKKCYCCGYFQ